MVRAGKFKGGLDWNGIAPGGATYYSGPVRWAWVATSFVVGGKGTTFTVQTGLNSVIWGWPSMDQSLEVISTSGGACVLAQVAGTAITATAATHAIMAVGY